MHRDDLEQNDCESVTSRALLLLVTSASGPLPSAVGCCHPHTSHPSLSVTWALTFECSNWTVGAKMTNVWSRIAAFTHKYPLSRGMVSYACIWPIGSCVQQKIQGKEKLDFWRAVRFSLYGCCFVAPTLYTWMTIAGYLFPKPGLRSGIYKALVEQVSYTPSAMVCFYFFMTLLEGGTVDEACEEVKAKFLPTYKAIAEQFSYGPFAICGFYSGMTLLEGGSIEDALNETKVKFLPTWQTAVCVWPIVQTVNFRYIPERNRVPFVSVCSFIWTVFLAYMKQRSQTELNKEEVEQL